MKAIIQLQPRENEWDITFLVKRLTEMEHRINDLLAGSQRVSFNTIKGQEVLHVTDIIRCASESNYCKIFMVDGSSILVSKTLKYVQSLLPSSLFIRVHSSHLVNKSFIRRIQKSFERGILLSDGQLIPYSKTYAESLEIIFQH
jgi:two-component system LytT family response regulator